MNARTVVAPCADCGTRRRTRSACPHCGKVFCQRCAEKPYAFCCDPDGGESAAYDAAKHIAAAVSAARGDPGCGTHAQAVADALIDAAKWVMLEASLFDEGKRLGAELVKRAVKVAGADYVALRLP